METDLHGNTIKVLALVSESADDMTRYVCELFGGMVNKHITQPCWTEHPYGPEQLRKRVYVVPVQDIRELHLTWPCEDMNDHWQSKVRRRQCCNICPYAQQPHAWETSYM